MRSKKVILDTNLWISFLISKNYNAIDELIASNAVKLIFSEELIEEFVAVASRPKLSKFFHSSLVGEILRLFDKYGKLIKVETQSNECRDSKDNFLLSLAIDSKADYLVTGDNDLLILSMIRKTKIITWSDFLRDLKAGGIIK